MKKLLLLFSFLLLMFSCVSVSAFSLSIKEELSVKAPIQDDYYVLGGRVNIENDIEGDLIIAGGEINIKGNIKEDLIISGGEINIEGKIGDDARVLGGIVNIENDIEGDLIIAGGEINIKKGVTIGGDLIVRAGKLNFEGDLKGKAKIGVETFLFDGDINGDVDLKAKNIELGEIPRINGNLNYKSNKENLEIKNIVLGEFNFEKDYSKNEVKNEIKNFKWLTDPYLIKILSLFIFSSLLYLFLEKFWLKTSNYLKENIGRSFLAGFLIFAAIPFIILFLFISVIGIPFGLFFLFMYIFLFVFYELFGTIIFSSLIIEKFGGNEKLKFWLKLIIILFITTLFVIIPWMIDIILVIFAYGAIYMKKIEILKR